MRYRPEDGNPDLLPEAWYDAVIARAEDTKAKKSGAEMLKITLEVLAPAHANARAWMDDYFVATVKSHVGKLKKLCAVLDIPFEGGEVQAAQLQGRNVCVYVKTQAGEGGYDDKNVPARYAKEIPSENGTPPTAPADSDVPF